MKINFDEQSEHFITDCGFEFLSDLDFITAASHHSKHYGYKLRQLSVIR